MACEQLIAVHLQAFSERFGEIKTRNLENRDACTEIIPLMSTALASFEVESLLSAILCLCKLMGPISCHLCQTLIAPIQKMKPANVLTHALGFRKTPNFVAWFPQNQF